MAFGVVYNPPPNVGIDPLKRIIEKIAITYEDIIIVGDFNIDLITKSQDEISYNHNAKEFNDYSASVFKPIKNF